MKIIKSFLILNVFLFTLLQGQTPHWEQDIKEIVIKFAEQTTRSQKLALNTHLAPKKTKILRNERYEVWEIPSSFRLSGKKFKSIDEVATYLTSFEEVELAEPNYQYQLCLVPNDPDFDKQWGLKNTGQQDGIPGVDINFMLAEDVDIPTPKRPYKIAILDSGIDWKHEDLVDHIWQNLGEDADGDGQVIVWDGSSYIFDPDDEDGIDSDNNGYVDDFVGWDFVNDDNNPDDELGHGTGIAGVIGAVKDNGIGISGIVDNKMVPIKIFGGNGNANLDQIISGIEYIWKTSFNQVNITKVANLSWGGTFNSSLLEDAILNTTDQEEGPITFIAAAGNNYGNNNDQTPIYPANYNFGNDWDSPIIISVAATMPDDRLAAFSNYGPATVDLGAPGHMIYSCSPNNSYDYFSGTSIATPFVTAAYAYIWTYCSYFPIDDLLNNVATNPNLQNKVSSGGRLDLRKSTEEVGFFDIDFDFVVDQLTVTLSHNYNSVVNFHYGENSWDGATIDLSHTYQNEGTYTVCMMLQSCPLWPSASKCKDITISTEPCEFVLVEDGDHCETGEHTIYGGAIPINTIESYAWYINDTLIANTKDITYNFTRKEDYKVKYRVEGNCSHEFNMDYSFSDHADSFDLGRYDNYFCDEEFVVDFNVENMKEYTWTSFPVVSGSSLGEKPDPLIFQSDGYVIGSVMDYCDNIQTDTMLIFFGNNCVWPGDVNDDGGVDFLDEILWSQYEGTVSSPLMPRSYVSTEWEARQGSEWELTQIDANGDGRIDSLDLDVIIQNYGKTRVIDFELNSTPLNTDLVITPVLTNIQTINGFTQMEMEIYVNRVDGLTIENLESIGFVVAHEGYENFMIDLSEGFLTDPNLGEPGYEIYLEEEGETHFLLENTNGLSGKGMIARFVITEMDLPSGDPLAITVDLGNSVFSVSGVAPFSTLSINSTSFNDDENNLGITLETKPVSCNNQGEIIAKPSGGVPPYQFLWSNNHIGDSLVNLGAQNYAVTLTDALGNSTAAETTVENISGIEATVYTFAESYNGLGSAAISYSGVFSTAYTVEWSTGATSSTINNLIAGEYWVEVNNGSGCVVRFYFTIEENLIKLTPSVMLEGPYQSDTDLMVTTKERAIEIPTEEPFTAMGQFVDNEGATFNKEVLDLMGINDLVDWVVVELRDGNDHSIVLASMAALLHRNGLVTALDGYSPVSFRGVSPTECFIVIRHRNHLDIMSANAIFLDRFEAQFSFMSSAGQSFGNNAQTKPGLHYAMYAGDANWDGQINAVDKNLEWIPQNGLAAEYFQRRADFNLDGAVNAVDKNLYWRINNSKIIQFIDD